MKKQLQGIAFILFGILLILFGVTNDTWIPIIDGLFYPALPWLGLLLGIVGLAFCLSKDHGDK